MGASKGVKGLKTVKKTAAGVSVTPGIIHGYARCSTNETRQDVERQVRELRAAGAVRIWYEYEHGDADVKEQQTLMFETMHPGDSVIIIEVPRIARSVRQLCDVMELVHRKKLRLQILGSITLDCRLDAPDPMSVAFLQIAGVFSELELHMIRARVRSGVANARAKGKRIGRPPITQDDIPMAFWRYFIQYQAGKINISELARLCQISRPTVYRYIAVAGNDHGRK